MNIHLCTILRHFSMAANCEKYLSFPEMTNSYTKITVIEEGSKYTLLNIKLRWALHEYIAKYSVGARLVRTLFLEPVNG